MKKEIVLWIGFIFVMLGVLFLGNYAFSINGFVVSEELDVEFSGLAGVWFVVAGIVVLVFAVATERGYELSKNERREIKDAFKDWDGRPNKRQKKVLRKYGLGFEEGVRHSHGRIGYSEGIGITVAASPSDWRGGRNLASEIVHLVEEKREEEREESYSGSAA